MARRQERMRKIVTRIKRGESIVKVMTEDGMLDVAKHPGMVLVGGLMHAGWTNFHCFVPWKPLGDALRDIRVTPDPALETKIFDDSLHAPWESSDSSRSTTSRGSTATRSGTRRFSRLCSAGGTNSTLSGRATTSRSKARAYGRFRTACTTYSRTWAYHTISYARRCPPRGREPCSSMCASQANHDNHEPRPTTVTTTVGGSMLIMLMIVLAQVGA